MRRGTRRDWETFDAYHEQDDVVVYWPGREKTPTRGGPDHRAESVRFCEAFPDNKVKHLYDILFGDGDYTAFVHLHGNLHRTARATRRDRDRADRQVEVAFSTIARWRDGKIVEEYLMDDNGSFLQQIGLASRRRDERTEG
jgi:SnoaL-like polyketide cyclase